MLGSTIIFFRFILDLIVFIGVFTLLRRLATEVEEDDDDDELAVVVVSAVAEATL